jgi:hypothetical protein
MQFEANHNTLQSEVDDLNRRLEQANRLRRYFHFAYASLHVCSHADGLLDDAKAQLEAQVRINRRNVDRVEELEDAAAEQSTAVCFGDT